MLAEAVAPDRLPLHMLRMIGDEKLDEALTIAATWMEQEQLEELQRHSDRIRVKPRRWVRAFKGCYVRMFGGLDVATPEAGRVTDRDWKKRKGRMLFAMLVARRGHDVPRDVLFDRLWPDMDGDRARNNYYVVLSSVKRALCGGTSKGRQPYIVVNGSMCSIDTTTVRSDLDDFDELLALANRAEADGDPDEAIRAYTDLAEIYCGDMLPGDIYDDWFSQQRDTYRQEFSDAMQRGAALLEAKGDLGSAIHLVRAALGVDGLREDLHQAAMRFQIAAGQRSAAVETYLACKARLAEDLGLDPSAETRRLYETILAMEGDSDPIPEVPADE